MAEQQNVDLGELALRLTAFARRTFADFGLRGHDTAVAGVGLSMHEEIRSSLPRAPDSTGDPPSLDELPGTTIDVPALLDEENYRKRVWASLAGEHELAEVVRVILDLNLHKPREIAAALGISATEVQNRKKRLRRRFIESNLVQGKMP